MFDLRKVEKETLSFWEENDIFEKSLENKRSAGWRRFVFFEGPPTANGLPHVGHFLTRVYKDLYGRYKTMRGYFVLRKAGWDTHGLPVEIEVEKELGFKSKKDIEKYGIAEFNKKAKENVWKYKTEWEEMTRRTGFWLDTANPYITYENKYIESLWAIIKKIWDKKLLYFAHRVVHFCTRCGTALSSHEVAQGYRTITDRSVIVKFKIQNSKLKIKVSPAVTTYVLAWTTTPWTLPGNVALAVGKSIDYALLEYNGDYYILAQDLIKKIFEPTTYNLQPTTYKGSDLVGLEYEPLFDIKELKSDKSYRIYDADFVSTEEGTGVVHTAVMYGEDDYNLGTKLGLPKFHTVDEQGKFTDAVPELAGMYVKNKATEDLIFQKLMASGYLLMASPYEHDYPFCWRCDTPLIYYAKESWFIKMSAVNKQLLKNNQKINWIPGHIKEGRFGQWLKEGKDWAFSRERYWGTPLPVWHCQTGKSEIRNPKPKTNLKQNGCGNVFVAGSLEDLEKHRYKPKNEYYVLRHGHTTRYESDGMIVNSRLESDHYHLTEQGVKEIEKVKKQILTVGIDEIYTSPFIRTKETAEIIGKAVNKNIKEDKRLTEISHNITCEGKEHRACPFEVGKGKASNDGESWNSVRKRMLDFMLEMEIEHSNKKILVVSHGDPLWLLSGISQGVSEKGLDRKVGWYPQIAELKKLEWKNIPRNEIGELDLHRPYIDRIILKCPKCKSKMTKVPDLIDVWFDAGAMPYAQWHWPFENKDMVDPPSLKLRRSSPAAPQFPADFIVEAIDQTRGWFYTLLAISTLLGKGTPYKNVMVLGHTLDEKGQKMSKSKGNFVPVMELMDKYGADILRWYFLSSMAMGESKSVIPGEIEDKQKGFLGTLDNCVRFYELYAAESKDQGLTTKALDPRPLTLSLLDQWILSRLNGLIVEATDDLDNYDPTSAARAIEKFVVEDFSNWWLRRSRKRKEALGLLRILLLELAKLLAPFTPFIAENIYHRLQGNRQIPISVHLHDWPEVNKKLINKKLEDEMDQVREIVTVGLALRKEKQIKVRQPLASLKLKIKNEKLKTKEELLNLIKEELNVKNVIYSESQLEDIILDTELTQPLIYEGYARELMRQIQDMRKEVKYRLDDEVFGQWHSDDKELSEAIRQWSDEIKKEVLLSEFSNSPHDGKAYDIEKELELVSQRKIWVGLRN